MREGGDGDYLDLFWIKTEIEEVAELCSEAEAQDK